MDAVRDQAEGAIEDWVMRMLAVAGVSARWRSAC